MSNCIFVIFLILGLSLNHAAGQIFSNQTTFNPSSIGIRVRLNEPLFSDASQIMHSLFAYRVQTVQIPQQQQCFPEGCFALFNFRITGFRQPQAITLRPMSPNYLHLSITSFDLDIIGLVSGNVNIVLTLPLNGGLVINANDLTVVATADIQKNQHRRPYLRLAMCELQGGLYDARVTDLGIFTDTINLKYKQEMIAKARDVIQQTICSNIDGMVRSQISAKLGQVPSSISLGDVFKLFDESGSSSVKTGMSTVLPTPAVNRQPAPRRSLPSRSEEIRRTPPRTIAHNQKQQQTPLNKVWTRHTITETAQAPTQVMTNTATQGQVLYYLYQDPAPFSGHSQPYYYYHDQWRQKRQAPVHRGIQRRGLATVTELEPRDKPVDDKDYDSLTSKTISTKNDNDDDYDLWGHSDNSPPTSSKSKNFPAPPPISRPSGVPSASAIPDDGEPEVPLEPPSLSKLTKMVNIEGLARMFVDFDFIDSVAGSEFFSVGINGLGFTKSAKGVVNYPPSSSHPTKLRFSARVVRRNVDVIVGEHTPNSLLLQAHRSRLLRVTVDKDTPTFGKMLRTSCSPDQVCLSDSINEVAEAFPNKQLEATIETLEAPLVSISRDTLAIRLSAMTTLYVADTKQTVGRLPFTTTIIVGVVQRDGKLFVTVHLTDIVFHDNLSFFNLQPRDLRGFGEAVKGTIQNLAKRHLGQGIDLRTAVGARLAKYGLSAFSVQLLEENLVLLQADVDVYKLAFDEGDHRRRH